MYEKSRFMLFALSLLLAASVIAHAAEPGVPIIASTQAYGNKAGSVLIYNLYSSSATDPGHNTAISMTNTNTRASISVHLFFINGATRQVADSYMCLTPNQTFTFKTSDADPGVTGYIIAIATDSGGYPLKFNYLLGSEYIKMPNGYSAKLSAEAVAGIFSTSLSFPPTSEVELIFDGIIHYAKLPRALALDEIGSNADGNNTLLVVNTIGGSLSKGAATVGTLFGLLYDDAESAVSFSLTGGQQCQLINRLSNTFPHVIWGFENVISGGRTGWLKIYNNQAPKALTGAAIRANANAATSNTAFNGGQNLHHLTYVETTTLRFSVFPPGC